MQAQPEPKFPNLTQHITIAGMTGSGKTTAALDMLSRRVGSIPWIIIDHKREPMIKRLPAEELSLRPAFLPKRGLHVVRPKMSSEDRQDLEDLLNRLFRAGKTGIYVDEGHLLGQSDAVRNIMVAGRSKQVPMMWTSQRAHWIDSFIWSQATFYRVFALQTKPDVKRFEENFPQAWVRPEPYHSHYFDGTSGRVFYLAPAAPIEETIKRLDETLLRHYRVI